MKRQSTLLVILMVAVTAMAAFVTGVVVGDRGDDRGRFGAGPMGAGVMTGAGSMGVGMMGRGSPGWSTGLSEPAFLAEMIAHHREAVAAAGELARSDRPEMRAFGQDIVRTQTAQIEQMEEWLAEWYPEQSLDVDYQPMMRDLTGLTGDRLDRVFLQDMVGHHMMAVMMSMRLLAVGPDHEAVADLARDIRDEQHAEILQMRRWLVTWFGYAGPMHGGMGMGMGMPMMGR